MTVVHERVAEAKADRLVHAIRAERAGRAGVLVGADARPISSGLAAVHDQQVLDVAGPDEAYIERIAANVRCRRPPAVLKSFTKADIEVPPVPPPSGKAYEKQLRKVVLNPLYKTIRERLSYAAGASMAYYEIMNMPMPDLKDLHSGVVKKYFNSLSGWHKKKIIAAFRAAIKLDVGVLLDDGPIRAALQERIPENVALIKTIPKKFQADLKKSFLDEFAEAPFDRQRLTAMLSGTYHSAGYNLRRIARDQTTKAIGQFTELRQKQIGVKEYRWSTSDDNRVRLTHQHNEGKVFSWDEAPAITGHPGWDIQCRCVAVAIIPQPETPAVAAPKPKPETPKPPPAVPAPKPSIPVPAPEPAVPVPVPAPTPPPPPTVAPMPDFSLVDEAWAARRRQRPPFKLEGSARGLGGAHDKEFWLDKQGNRWMFKPAKRAGDEFIVYGEEAAYKVGRLVDEGTIEVRAIRLDKRTGSIQPLNEDLKSPADFSGFSPVDLTPEELAQLQREHVIDWLVSNHDGHRRQFLRGADGHIYGIDKGPAYKHLGEDRLSIDYHPNRAYGEEEPFYNTIFRAVKNGELKVDPAATLAAIRKVENITDEAYLAILQDYAKGRFKRDRAGLRAFYDAALARKNNIRKDFEAFYADVLGDPGFRFERVAGEVSDVGGAVVQGRLGAAHDRLLREVDEAGWQGKTLSLDADDIEDQNALLFVETAADGKPRTVMRFKVRKDSEPKLLAQLQRAGADVDVAAAGAGLPDDLFGPDILDAVKTVNYHASTGNYNQAKLDKMMNWIDPLTRLQQYGANAEVKEMATYYLDWIKRVHAAASKKVKITEQFSFYVRRVELPDVEPGGVPFAVVKTKVRQPIRELEAGDIRVLEDGADNSAVFGFDEGMLPDGEQFLIEFGDDLHLVYRPATSKNLFAQHGEFEITMPGRPDAKSLERALDHLETLGLNGAPASAVDAEIMYLQKYAYLTKEVQDTDYIAFIADLDLRKVPKSERLAALRGYWQKKLKVDSMDDFPAYNPAGEYQAAFRGDGKAGYRLQYRFDITEEDLERQMKGTGLFHALTNDRDMPEFVDKVLSSNGAMVSTTEKVRAGIPVGGMSPAEDMSTGGGTYVFSRIMKVPTKRTKKGRHAGLYFKKDLLRRFDAISYDNDYYGKVKDGHVLKHRMSSLKDLKRMAHPDNDANETIFKSAVPLVDNLDTIVVVDKDVRERLIDVFTKHGVTELPDGRRIQDAILVK